MIRPNDDAMQARIFPLREGVPYQTRNGVRVILSKVAEEGGYLTADTTPYAYDADHGYIFSDVIAEDDIVDFRIEEGVWETRNGTIVELVRRDGYSYPFSIRSNTVELTSCDKQGYVLDCTHRHDLDIAGYVGRADSIPIPDDFLSEGYWLRRDGRVVRLEYNRGFCRFVTPNGIHYELRRDGRYYQDGITAWDLMRKLVVGEERDTESNMNIREFMMQGLLLTDSRELTEIPPVWLEFIKEWDTYTNSWEGAVTLILHSMLRYPNEITFKIEQMYLHSRYITQISASIWTDTSDVLYRLTGEYKDTLQYILRDGEVKPIVVPRHFIHGGVYHADVPPRFHNIPGVKYNRPHQTVNTLTNWKAEIERELIRKIHMEEYVDVPDGFPTKWGTGAHMSTQNPELLAYYPTLRHWQRKVPQQIKPGRYLRQYFPEMSDDKVRRLSALCTGGDLKFFTKWQDMLAIYQQLSNEGIVSSCMSYDKWGAMHPLMVYDNSDVELAVLYMDDKPVARALYNKHNKHFPMVYGQWEKMEAALRRAGFKHDSLCGSKIKKLPRYVSVNRDWIDQNGLDGIWDMARDQTILMPYIDHKRELDRSHNCSTSVDVLDNYVRITEDGTFEANDHENAQLGDSDMYSCECCGDMVDEDTTSWVDADEIRVCEHCWDNHVVEVYTGRNRTFTALQSTATNNYIYIDNASTWFRDSDAIESCGWVWSSYADEYIAEDDAVWVVDEEDYYPTHAIGDTIVYDDVDCEYITKETYEALMQEREQDQAA